MSAVERLLERPLVYRLWQKAAMAEAKIAPVLADPDRKRARRVLDLGCGPGTNARHFAGREYLGVDLEPRYVAAARRRHPGLRFEVGDAAVLDLPGERFDLVLVNSLLHHLDDDDVERALSGVARVLEPAGHVHVLDLVLSERPGPARALARWDRGDFPRPLSTWRELLGRHFEPVRFEPYSLSLGVPLWHMVHFKGRIPA